MKFNYKHDATTLLTPMDLKAYLHIKLYSLTDLCFGSSEKKKVRTSECNQTHQVFKDGRMWD